MHIANHFVIACYNIIHFIVLNFVIIILVLIFTNKPFLFFFLFHRYLSPLLLFDFIECSALPLHPIKSPSFIWKPRVLVRARALHYQSKNFRFKTTKCTKMYKKWTFQSRISKCDQIRRKCSGYRSNEYSQIMRFSSQWLYSLEGFACIMMIQG